MTPQIADGAVVEVNMAIWTQFFWVAGAVAVGAVTVQALWITYDAARRGRGARRQELRAAELLAERIRAVRKQAAATEDQALIWNGWRKFEVKRKVFEDAGRTQASLYLVPHDRKRFPPFRPGQFLTFQLEVPGESRPVVRCYSLSDCYRPDHYRVTIKRAPAPARASGFFLDAVGEGSIIDVRAPGGPFCLDLSREDPVVLIGSGIGVTPVLAMLNAIVAAPSQRETWFFYGARNSEEAIFVDAMREIARSHPNVHLHICYSRPKESDVAGRDYDLAGRVSVDLFRKLLPSNNYDFYLCGPTAMMDDIKSGLAAWGVPKEKVHFEDFSPPREAAKLDAASATGPPITFRKSGKTVNWNTQAKNLLEFALANGVSIDAGCWLGNCGTCQRAVLSGQFEYGHKVDYTCEAGTCLTCCAVPKGAMEIDA